MIDKRIELYIDIETIGENNDNFFIKTDTEYGTIIEEGIIGLLRRELDIDEQGNESIACEKFIQLRGTDITKENVMTEFKLDELNNNADIYIITFNGGLKPHDCTGGPYKGNCRQRGHDCFDLPIISEHLGIDFSKFKINDIDLNVKCHQLTQYIPEKRGFGGLKKIEKVFNIERRCLIPITQGAIAVFNILGLLQQVKNQHITAVDEKISEIDREDKRNELIEDREKLKNMFDNIYENLYNEILIYNKEDVMNLVHIYQKVKAIEKDCNKYVCEQEFLNLENKPKYWKNGYTYTITYPGVEIMENMNLLRFSTTDGIVWYKMDKDNNKKIIGAKNLQEKFKNSPDTTIRFKLDNNTFCSLR